MAPKTTLMILASFSMGVFALAIPAAVAAPAPDPIAKDIKIFSSTEVGDLGRQTGRIRVDNVDLSRLRVDPVVVELHNRDGNIATPVMPQHQVLTPTPYLEAPLTVNHLPVGSPGSEQSTEQPLTIDKKTRPHLGRDMARSEMDVEEKEVGEETLPVETKYVPRWRRKHDAGHDWLNPA